MVNNVVIMGRLVRDAEERTTSSGKNVCSFCVAVDDEFNKEITHFLDVIAWNKTATFVCNYFRKGSMIAVTGRLATRNWEDKNGSKHKAVEIVADKVSFCGSKSENNTPSVAPPSDEEYRDIPDDEILPF